MASSFFTGLVKDEKFADNTIWPPFSEVINVGDIGRMPNTGFDKLYDASELPIRVPDLVQSQPIEFEMRHECHTTGSLQVTAQAIEEAGGTLKLSADITFDTSDACYFYTPSYFSSSVKSPKQFGEDIWNKDRHRYKNHDACVYAVFRCSTGILIASTSKNVTVTVDATYTNPEGDSIEGTFTLGESSSTVSKWTYPPSTGSQDSSASVFAVNTLRWGPAGAIVMHSSC